MRGANVLGEEAGGGDLGSVEISIAVTGSQFGFGDQLPISCQQPAAEGDTHQHQERHRTGSRFLGVVSKVGGIFSSFFAV